MPQKNGGEEEAADAEKEKNGFDAFYFLLLF